MAHASFFEKIWTLTRAIPPGRVATYGQLAAYAGQPRAARTVGWALHSMPADADIPWQRVINARGQISSRRCEHTVPLQQSRLEAEGVVFRNETVDLDTFQWRPSMDEVDAILADFESD